MKIINFTRYATAVSDFEAEATVDSHMQQLEANEKALIETCNLLIWQMLRGKLLNNPIKFDIVWQFEGSKVDMDVNLRSDQFWQYSVTSLEEKATFRLLEPTTLRSSESLQ